MVWLHFFDTINLLPEKPAMLSLFSIAMSDLLFFILPIFLTKIKQIRQKHDPQKMSKTDPVISKWRKWMVAVIFPGIVFNSV